MDTPLKRCSTCETFKPITEFHKNRRRPDGLQAVCKSCTSLYGKRHYKNNTDKVKKTHAEWRGKNGEENRRKQREKYHNNREKESERKRIDHYLHPEKYKLRSMKYREANIDEIRRKEREHYIIHRDQILQQGREHYAANPRQAFIRLQRRRARKAALPDNYTSKQWDFALEYWQYSCAVCGSPHQIELDHWIPLNHPSCTGTIAKNIIPLCAKCNRSKSFKLPDEWLRIFHPKNMNAILGQVAKYFSLLPALDEK